MFHPDYAARSGSSHQAAAPPVGVATVKRRSRYRLVVGVSIVAVIAVVVSVLIDSHGSSSDADATVIKAVDGAIAGKSAQVSETGTVQADGKSVTTTATGSVDFTNSAISLTVHVNADGQNIDEQAIYLGGIIYEALPQIAQVAPGKSWISLDLSSLVQSAGQSTSALGGNPLAMLHALAQQGNTVADLGPTMFDGQSVESYSVTFNTAAVQSQMDKANLPGWMKQIVSHLTVNGVSQKVYVTSAGDLAGEDISYSESAGSVGTVTLNQSLAFSNYGTQVSIAPPPADQVIPFDQFLKQAEASQPL